MKGRFSTLLIAVIVVGLGIGVGAGAIQAKVNEKRSNAAATTPASQTQAGTSSASQSQSAAQAQAQGGAFGTVQGVSSGGFSLAAQTGTVKVVTNSSTKVSKLVDAKLPDLKVGDSVTATGNQQSDGSLAALSIQAGGADSARAMAAGMMGFQGNRSGQFQGSGTGDRAQATPQAGGRSMGGAQGARGSAVMGTIEAIDGQTITVKTQAGSSAKVTASDSTSIRKLADGALSEIKDGLAAIVSGERNGEGAIVATTVELLPAGVAPAGR